ncbi:MAG: aminotransferase class I/II-fold pyridoxal phosphate-dependent enzyme [Candidatus Brocadiae bacterium]|nr:aminotransferase class I/II-fold pyridoxal phosphate-dependent enzyme [Candidatus Brocadiia bacterium]
MAAISLETRASHVQENVYLDAQSASEPVHFGNAQIYKNIEDYIQSCTLSFSGEKKFYYARMGNPTNRMLEEKIAALENAQDALVVSSGMAAFSSTIFAFCNHGKHIVAPINLSADKEIFLEEYIQKFSIRVDRVDFQNLDSLRCAIRPDTRLVFVEFPSVPFSQTVDLEAIAQIVHEKQVLFVVDSTTASPSCIKPLDFHADLVVASASKYMSGHSDCIGGYIAGNKTLLTQIANQSLMLGNVLGPMDAASILKGSRTLDIRMERHTQNAMEVASFLSSHSKVSRVFYPGLPENPEISLAKKQMKRFGGMIFFSLHSDLQSCFRFLNSIRLCYIGFSFGDSMTILEHLSSMSYLGVSSSRKNQMGISDSMLRISVGIEKIDDILRDLDYALRKA